MCVWSNKGWNLVHTNSIKKYLVPFIEETFHCTEYRFMQHNDPKHTSRVAKAFYNEKGINW